jgi:23S rRNA pseudouridine2604 synthase
LIFLTSNGDLVNKILRAGNHHEKEYLVTVDKPITDEFILGMSSGVSIFGVNTRKCVVTKESPFVFKIILIQGMNRQIRRMCEHFGYEVTKLERTRIMNISLKGLPLGEWRELSEQEMAGIYKMVRNSSSTEEASKSARAMKPSQPTKTTGKRPLASDKPAGRNPAKLQDKSGKKPGANTDNRNRPARGKSKAPVKGKPKSPRR